MPQVPEPGQARLRRGLDGAGDQGRLHRHPDEVRGAEAGVRAPEGGPQVPPGVGDGERGGQAVAARCVAAGHSVIPTHPPKMRLHEGTHQ